MTNPTGEDHGQSDIHHPPRRTDSMGEMTRKNVDGIGDAYTAYIDRQHIIIPIPVEKKEEIDALHASRKEIFDAEMNRDREWDADRRMVEDAVRTGE